MVYLKAWTVVYSGLGAELWHVLIALAFYLWFAIRIDRSLSSGRALRLTLMLIIAAECEEAIEKAVVGWRNDPLDILFDLRDGALWPCLLWLFGKRSSPSPEALSR